MGGQQCEIAINGDGTLMYVEATVHDIDGGPTTTRTLLFHLNADGTAVEGWSDAVPLFEGIGRHSILCDTDGRLYRIRHGDSTSGAASFVKIYSPYGENFELIDTFQT